jgi:hypothetical protein
MPLGLAATGGDGAIGGPAEVPAAFMAGHMVAATEQDAVVLVGLATVEPMDDVVDVAPLPRDATAIELAVLVADGDRTP